MLNALKTLQEGSIFFILTTTHIKKGKKISDKQSNITINLSRKRIMPKVRRKIKLIKSRAEINEMEIRKTIAQ